MQAWYEQINDLKRQLAVKEKEFQETKIQVLFSIGAVFLAIGRLFAWTWVVSTWVPFFVGVDTVSFWNDWNFWNWMGVWILIRVVSTRHFGGTSALREESGVDTCKKNLVSTSSGLLTWGILWLISLGIS